MALDTKATEAASAIAKAAADAMDEKVDTKDIGTSEDGVITPVEMIPAAKKLPEKDPVQKAIKAGMLAKSRHAEHKEKVKVVKASPNAEETPSGAALVATESISDDDKRAASYRAVKSAYRHGVINP